MELREKLVEKQAESGLSDEAFAASLNITPTMWFYIKGGQRDMGKKVLRGIRRNHPELIPDLLDYLNADADQTAGVGA
jgi:hypothetical protein